MISNQFFRITLYLIVFPIFLFGQQKMQDRVLMHRERPDLHSIPTSPDEIKTSPAYSFRGDGIYTTQVNVSVTGDNILGDAANEPSIAVDPIDPNRIMIGWRQFDDVGSSFRQAGYAYSLDAGETWNFPGSIDAGVFRSDPVLGCDPEGNFYYNSLTVDAGDVYTCTVYKTSEGGIEWDEGTYAFGGDKQWMAIDNTDGIGSGNNYSYWTQWYSICYPGFFTRSSDLGASYESCVQVTGYPHWGTLAVGPDGELYIAGAGDEYDVILVKSSNAQVPGSTISWQTYTPVYLGGFITGWTDVNPAGLLGQVYVGVDASGGPGDGNVYVLASVDTYSQDPADVVFARSTNGGLSFEDPVRINDDAGSASYQWFGTMSVAPNGRIDVVWLDTRLDLLGGVNSALYYSYSTDQGISWSPNKQLSEQFNPHLGWPQQEKMGDYFHMVSDEDGAHLAWANTFNSEQDVYYSYIEPETVGLNDPVKDESLISISNYPNPFIEHTTIRYTVPRGERVRIAIYDLFGKEVSVVLDQYRKAGIHTTVFPAGELKAGVYVCKIFVGDEERSSRLVKTQ
jgi:hypothetical protein